MFLTSYDLAKVQELLDTSVEMSPPGEDIIVDVLSGQLATLIKSYKQLSEAYNDLYDQWARSAGFLERETKA